MRGSPVAAATVPFSFRVTANPIEPPHEGGTLGAERTTNGCPAQPVALHVKKNKLPICVVTTSVEPANASPVPNPGAPGACSTCAGDHDSRSAPCTKTHTRPAPPAPTAATPSGDPLPAAAATATAVVTPTPHGGSATGRGHCALGFTMTASADVAKSVVAIKMRQAPLARLRLLMTHCES